MAVLPSRHGSRELPVHLAAVDPRFVVGYGVSRIRLPHCPREQRLAIGINSPSLHGRRQRLA